MRSINTMPRLLDPGFDLTLRPMHYPIFYDMYNHAIRNTWTVEEVDFSSDLIDLNQRFSPGKHHLIQRLVTFFATGDTIVANNLVLNFYQHINSPEGRMYLSRQLAEEAEHVRFYLTLLDTYMPDPAEREKAFAAVEHIPSIRQKAQFCFRWIDSLRHITRLQTKEDRRMFLLNLICFGACIEGLFFFAAFAYVYFLRSQGLLHGLSTGTNWVFRDESMHMAFAFEVVRITREEEPDLFDHTMKENVVQMLEEAIQCELQFAMDLLEIGVNGLSIQDVHQYLKFVADQRLNMLDLSKHFKGTNPFPFMDLQDVQELTHFFERRASAYQVGIKGGVSFDAPF
ncbi:ribonucleotide-diphosphate reductase subunit beta [Pajaroellobacter abortibovis]|uniref:Ribonucleoside-diphosphate reductase subunit beta n=1 Tax=Pajaroellobacter abortibovis TaxID=1882918 RepID=A0A1L6MY00_9BACT|nr:ribonucleotide-diphosphate reductase subunit beta [Pajaroellobacter abortibovis]APS00356.1 ribonucleoside-diphosphate reductase [Pajaroellobacter abortibovis]